ncbi:MAG: hypothetical protein F6K63_14585 [Moorea sp. SIO1G6]|uniref:hypothetical protein n=1 Tax=Moorena sp. SIO1G6 TaxID=2607840 RepID=UPI0013C1B0DF|nr:hypothetical protein [Moorena sp. SIO1G6]NET65542.1 hypothetical protein [Moorena sp. SIO1G6]
MEILFPVLMQCIPIKFSLFPTPDSRLPTPVPLLGGVRGGFRLPTPDSRLPN